MQRPPSTNLRFPDVGGAMRLGGEVDVSECSFLSISATSRGPAVAVLASTTISNSSFDRNELCCGAGSYREDTEEVKRNGRCVAARPVAVFCLRPCSLVRYNTLLLIIVRIVNASRLVDQPWEPPATATRVQATFKDEAFLWSKLRTLGGNNECERFFRIGCSCRYRKLCSFSS